MGVAAIGGFENANGRAMDFWEAVYPNILLVTLTDTFSTEVFYQVRSAMITKRTPLAEIQRTRGRTSSRTQKEPKGGPD